MRKYKIIFEEQGYKVFETEVQANNKDEALYKAMYEYLNNYDFIIEPDE